MKRFITLLVSAMTAFTVVVAAYAASPFSALQSQTDVTRVYISKALMKMGMSQISGMTDNLPLGPETVLDDMEVYTCESAQSAKKAKTLFDKYLNDSDGAQELLSVTEEDEKTVICGVPGSGEGFFRTLIIFTSEVDEATVVIINGNIQIDSLMQ